MSLAGGLDGPWQVLSDCPHCRVEAAVVEWMDPSHPACHFGMPAETRCRLCGWTVRAHDAEFAPKLGIHSGRCPNCAKPLQDADLEARTCPSCTYAPGRAETGAPADLTDPERARAALLRWAHEEGETSVETFCVANMGTSADEVLAKLSAHKPVGTTFDVIAFLFPSAGGAGGSSVTVAPRESAKPATEDHTMASDPKASDPRVPIRALVSVMAADGEIRPGEQRFIETFSRAEGLGGIGEGELRIWRPHELARPDRADKLVEAMVHLAHLDRQRDGSEWKVVLAFARSWGVPESDVDRWDRQYDRRYATAMTLLWRTLSNFVRLH